MPDDSADQIFEELQDIVQQAILREFPNPERKGCLGPDVLRELANRPRPTRDADWEHVTHCSPCYREFLDLRAQVKQQQELRRRRTLRKRALAAALAVLGACAVLGGYEMVRRGVFRSGGEPGQYQVASLDLKDRSVARSIEGQSPKTQPLVLPAKRLDLTVFLPMGSEPGRYDVQFLKRIDQPLITLSGEATVEHGTTLLRAKMDLTGQPAGSFLIGLRQPPADWTYYPVTIQ